MSIRTGVDNASTMVEITPSDTDRFNAYRSLFIGTAGNLAIEDQDGNVSGPFPVPAGFILPVCVVRVLATGTTADDIYGLR